MKNKANEWVSISDLMAGVMAVVMLLLVMSVLQKTYAEIKHKTELENKEAVEYKKIEVMLTDLHQTVKEQEIDNLMIFDVVNKKITLKDNIFEKGSACITPSVASAFENINIKIADFLQDNPQTTIYIEGHTDSAPVTSPVIDYRKFCAVYDDNFILSAARAREARKLLTTKLNDVQSKQIIVAGFGDSHLIEGLHSEDARNRRVEIRFSILEEGS